MSKHTESATASSISPSMAQPLLEIDGLSKHFTISAGMGRKRTVRAVEDVHLTIARGEVLAIVGESGSGKTTMASLVARLLDPTKGQIRLDGVPTPRSREHAAVRQYRQRVQMVFQDPFAALNPVHDIRHHLIRPMLSLGVAHTSQDAERRAESLLTTVGLTPPEDFLAKLPHQLSGGQRQRVVIARALAAEPDLLLADEPTSMLDVSIRMGIMNLLLDLCSARGLGMLYITHDLAGARYVANRIAVMYAGRIVESGLADDVVASPSHPYTQLLLSSVFTLERRGSLLKDPIPAHEPRTTVGAAGCPFAPRCPFVMAICRTDVPPRMPAASQAGHEARCFLLSDRALGPRLPQPDPTPASGPEVES